MQKPYYIIIVGSGRLGSRLANQCSSDGHKVVVIDRDEGAFDRLSIEFTGYKMVGDATEKRMLISAQCSHADFVFAVTSNDNVNLMIAQMAMHLFDTPHVVVRIDDPAREALYREFGIHTISPTHLAADAFMSEIQSEMKGR